MSKTQAETEICTSCRVCEYCGLPIEQNEQKCLARDDANCRPVAEESDENYCSKCGEPLGSGIL